MIRKIKGDLLTAQTDVICHQVNCRGVMGSGVARQIREKFPEVYRQYRDLYEKTVADGQFSVSSSLLGTCQMVPVERDGRKFYIANLFAQNAYGRDGKQYTDEDAFRQCICLLRMQVSKKGLSTIAMPYKIGCGRGGADWNTIYPIIGEGLRGFDVTFFEYTES